MDVALPEPVLQQILSLTTNGIQAARSIPETRAPWHHMAYIPFQISSISQLREAIQCLQAISSVYNTPATQNALRTARSLILLHQRGKEMFALALNDILKTCPINHPETTTKGSTTLLDTAHWSGNLSSDVSEIHDIDMEHFLGPEFFWNAGSNGIL